MSPVVTIPCCRTEEAVQQTHAVLSQMVAVGGSGRKVVGRSQFSSGPAGRVPSHTTATSLLLTSTLPPELTVGHLGQHISLGRTVSDSQTKLRRKLESEDSSYDSDHEGLIASLSHPYHGLSRSHDDISRTPSETLAQEYADYVSTYPPRDASPVQDTRLASVRETPDHTPELKGPQYTAKVEYGLKMGYAEKLTQKALTKVGLDAGQDELLQELIRLQESKSVDPEVSQLLTKTSSKLTCFRVAGDPIERNPRAAEGINTQPIGSRGCPSQQGQGGYRVKTHRDRRV